MPLTDFVLPLGGESHGLPVANQEQGTSGYMSNCRPRDVLEGRLRIGQRPGLKKAYAQQVGGAASPIVWQGFASVVSSSEGISDEFHVTGDDSIVAGDGANDYLGQTFTTTSAFYIGSVGLKLYRVGNPGAISLSIYATTGGAPTGDALTTGSFNGNSLTTSSSGAWYEVSFSSYSLSNSTMYAIVFSVASQTASNYVCWRCDTDSGYAGGKHVYDFNDAGSWTQSNTIDCMFRVYKGVASPVTYSKQLIAIGNDEVWREATIGTMSEVSAANASLDTNATVNAIVAFQKVFIVNGTTKRVLDLVNTKIATDTVGSDLPNIGNVLVGVSSTAEMIVDYIDASSGACNIYGFRTTGAIFTSGETVGCTNDAGGTVSFTISANETAPPHWYAWTVYAGDTTTYGTMLSEPTLVELYRGRVVISGDKTIPHAWQMFKVGNPFKVLYDFTNDADLSAVTYSNNKVGKIGDTVRSTTAYKDDIFIFGCDSSIWVLIGDPLADGQLIQLTKTTGVWGDRAWCIDSNNNFYFLGDNGIYKVPISESMSTPTNISKRRLPNLIKDWDLDSTLHEVTLSYDPVKEGIIISRTLLSDGTNTNYWFDLTTNGFFKEVYHANCGIFSSCFYPATDETYKKFLVGGADGYIREFDNATENDVTTTSTSVIDSYCTIVLQMGEDEEKNGLLREFVGIVAGGGEGGDFSDSDSITYNLYRGKDAETVLEKTKATTAWADGASYVIGNLVTYSSVEYICIVAHTSATGAATHEEPDTNTIDWETATFTSGTWSSTGKTNRVRARMRGVWAALKLRNSSASETWGVEKIYGNIIPKGKR